MKQCSPSAPKVLGLLATFLASIPAPAALAEAVAKPSAPVIGRMCETDAARLARAAFSQQAVSALAARAGCALPGSSAALAQRHFVASPVRAPFTAARISMQSPVGVDAFPPPLTTAIGFEPADVAPAQSSNLAVDGAALAAYRSQGPISTYGQDETPVGLRLGFAF